MFEYEDKEFISVDEEIVAHPLKLKIADLVDEYRQDNENKWPTDLFISTEDEIMMCTLNTLDIGDKLVTDFTLNGPRNTFSTWWGMKVHWDSEYTVVSGE